MTENLGSDDTRLVRFPANRSLGGLHYRDFGVSGGWIWLGEATGDVHVPLGKELRLKVSEEAAADLSPLRALELDDLQWLDLSRTPAGDEQLDHLVNLTLLRRLDLHGAPVGDAGLKRLRPLAALRELRLNETRITDVGVLALMQLPELETLWLFDTEVTDACVRPLMRMKSLRILQLPKRLSPAALAPLRAALPECYVNQR